ncbi:WD40 repeat domain-containing protein [Streptomyces sp. Ru72]|uniref:WD40 repeat domain-containing protein n=1 Tax=Streptomyces sp. Ru72 TaxID=2080747 RepID=UPI0015E32F59|nr:hypothetical protein [Streptomyces sp. Ru72]
MDSQSSNPQETPRTFEQELGTLAEQLKELWVTCGGPAYRQVVSRAPDSQHLSVSGISEALNGKRLPELNYLIALVRTLLSFQDGKPVHRDDRRLQPFRDQWRKAKRLKQRRRSASASPQPTTSDAAQESTDVRQPAPAEASMPVQSPTPQRQDSSPGSAPETDRAAERKWEAERAQLLRALRSATTRIEDLVDALYDRIPDNGHTLGPPWGSGALAFSPSDDLIATGELNQVRLWDSATGRPVGEPLVGDDSHVKCLAFSPQGDLLASGYNDGTLRLWNPATGWPVGEPHSGHDSQVQCLAFSPDGQLLASLDDDGSVRLWNPVTGRPVGEPLAGHESRVYSLAFSPDGLLATGNIHKVQLWDPTIGTRVSNIIWDYDGVVTCLAFSPDGHLLATGDNSGSLRLWHPATGRSMGAPLGNHTSPVNCVAFSPDGRLLASADGSTVRLWDPNTRCMVGDAFNSPHPVVDFVAFSREGRVLASSGGSSPVCLRKTPTDWSENGKVLEPGKRRRKGMSGWLSKT